MGNLRTVGAGNPVPANRKALALTLAVASLVCPTTARAFPRAGTSQPSPAAVYAALKAHPIPDSALPRGFRFVMLHAERNSPSLVFEVLRGPDALDVISYFIVSSIAQAKLGFSGIAASATNVRGVGGFRSPAVLFDHIATGADAKTGCGSSARVCASTTLGVRSGFVVVSCVAAVANARTGDARAAVAIAKSALGYLLITERHLGATGK